MYPRILSFMKDLKVLVEQYKFTVHLNHITVYFILNNKYIKNI